MLGRQRFKTLTAQDMEALARKTPTTSNGSAMQIQNGMGVEHSGKIFALFGVIIGLLYDVLTGGKVRAFNLITKAVSAFIKAREVFKDSGIVWDEMRDIDAMEREQLAKTFIDSLDIELDLSDPATVERVDNAIKGIIDLTALATRAKA